VCAIRIAASGTVAKPRRAPRWRRNLRSSSCAFCGRYVSIAVAAAALKKHDVGLSLHHVRPGDACQEADMTKRSFPTLLYAGTHARRWAQAALIIPDAELQNLCVWQWSQAASSAAAAAEENARTLRVGAFGDTLPNLVPKGSRR
jgi:hypothetical protein